jgi:hypothetical protein
MYSGDTDDRIHTYIHTYTYVPASISANAANYCGLTLSPPAITCPSSLTIPDTQSINQSVSDTPVNAALVAPSAESVCDSSAVLSNVLIPMAICWPLWLRFAQNMKQLWETGRRWPFLANAGKYMLNHSVVIFATLHHDFLMGKVRTHYLLRLTHACLCEAGRLLV